MTKHALIYDGKIIEEKEVHPNALKSTKAGYKWIPIEIVYQDNSKTDFKVYEDTIVTIEKDRVIKTTTIRDKTDEEIEVEKQKELDDCLERIEIKFLLAEINNIREAIGLGKRSVTQIEEAIKRL